MWLTWDDFSTILYEFFFLIWINNGLSTKNFGWLHIDTYVGLFWEVVFFSIYHISMFSNLHYYQVFLLFKPFVFGLTNLFSLPITIKNPLVAAQETNIYFIRVSRRKDWFTVLFLWSVLNNHKSYIDKMIFTSLNHILG